MARLGVKDHILNGIFATFDPLQTWDLSLWKYSGSKNPVSLWQLGEPKSGFPSAFPSGRLVGTLWTLPSGLWQMCLRVLCLLSPAPSASWQSHEKDKWRCESYIYTALNILCAEDLRACWEVMRQTSTGSASRGALMPHSGHASPMTSLKRNLPKERHAACCLDVWKTDFFFFFFWEQNPFGNEVWSLISRKQERCSPRNVLNYSKSHFNLPDSK